MNDIKKMQAKIVSFRDKRNWKQFNNPKDMAISLSLEASEVMECFQWKSPQEIDDYLKNNKDHLSDELVDTLYWVLLIAYDLNINLEQAFDRKMQANEAKYAISKSKGNHKKYTELGDK